MSKTVKVILIVCACLLVVCSGIAGVGYYWVTTSGKQYFNQMSESAKSTVLEGAKFGRTTDQNGCVQEALNRLKSDDSFNGQLNAGIFLEGCNRTSAPVAGFCDGVPGKLDILKTNSWALQRCNAIGSTDKNCPQLMRAVQRVCLRDKERAENGKDNK